MKTPNNTRFLSGILKTSLLALAASSLLAGSAQAQQGPIKTVWYILLENRNWSENENSGGAQILGSSAAPYLNSLVTPNTAASAQVSYCSAYHNVLATASGNNPSIHPSEPNYVWMECGSNNSKGDDNDPYGSGASVQQIFNYAQANASTGTVSMQNLSGLLQNVGIGWYSYSEGTQQLNSVGNNYNQNGGTLTNNLPALSLWTVPVVSFSGSSSLYTNPYNGTHQYNFATKHTGQLFFPATNGCTVNTADSGTTNVEASHYPPLPQLTTDLANGTCAPYSVITPDQYNDMHTALSSNFTYNGVTYPANGDLEKIAQGDNFCSIVVPQIMASQQYKNGGAIVIWTDETEGSNQNDFNHTLAEIVISPYAKGNAYQSTLNYTHSSDVATMQEIFGVTANTPSGYLADAANYSQATPTGTTGVSQIAGATSWSTAFTQAASTGGGFGSGGPLNNGSTRDMADLFVPNTIPALPALNYTASGYTTNRHNPGVYVQTITVTNNSGAAVTNPVYLVVSNLSSNTVLSNSAGTTVNNYAGSPYVLVSSTGLAAGASASVTLQFHVFLGGGIADTLDPIQTSAQP